MTHQAAAVERAGFTSLWSASGVGGDPLVAMAMAGRATTTIELGTAVLQTYPCHPVLMANRPAIVVSAAGRVTAPQTPVPVLLAALGPRLLRVAGEIADGTVTWMANARAIEHHIS